MAASVCRKLALNSALSERPFALMIPALTDVSNSNGCPTANTQSPMRSASDGQVGGLIGSHFCRVELSAVRQLHHDFVGILDDMPVGENEPTRVYNNPGT
jgi:hypothetical protein